MCGIFGLVVSEKTRRTAAQFENALSALIRHSEPRGREASGFAISMDGKTKIFKKAGEPRKLTQSVSFSNFVKSSLGRDGSDTGATLSSTVAAIGHCRLVTNGSRTVYQNNQPVVVGDTVGVHNGIITNEKALMDQDEDPNGLERSDSELLFRLIDAGVSASKDLHVALRDAYKKIDGEASIGFLRNDLDALLAATNTGSIYWVGDHEHGCLVFASERVILERCLAGGGIFAGLKSGDISQLRSGQALLVPFSDTGPELFDIAAEDRSICSPSLLREAPYGTIHDAAAMPLVYRRCSRCVLPHTYPFIEFDDDGVCNYCRAFKKQTVLGRDALERVLAPFRSADGSPDCIMGLSGGRDSSYGLHLLKTEFGMNPIAYTYDWGLVTDLARRNQARLCGALGVDHIIRADDITTKRRYIRKNIAAWLKRPELGMVPLFMAGDKMFLHHARVLRRETGIKLFIFCSGNELERCEFKIGFCGVDSTTVHEIFYRYPIWQKMHIAIWYAKEYLLNPSYFNESLLDSLFAFYSSFVARDDFLQLYHYVPWDEKMIDQTLKEKYQWESAADSENTWRIGDGYTSFINYIYYTVAGFSEYDTFRSNQIRSGIISREQAMELIAADNQPKFDRLKEFANVVGISFEETLFRINQIPKL
jgi:glutamine---fructose-6-phosphate transaminase (isomerizing)